MNILRSLISVKTFTTVALLAFIGLLVMTYLRIQPQTDSLINIERQQVTVIDRSISGPVNGVNVLYYATENEDSILYNQQFVDRLQSLGTTHIAIAIPIFQTADPNVVTSTNQTPDIDNVGALIALAKSRDMHVTLKPILDGTQEDYSRSDIRPTDLNDWFTTYFAAMEPWINLANKHDVDAFSVGVELSSIQDESNLWIQTIIKTRARFNGSITYAANWDAPNIPFIDELDYVGYDGYFPYDGVVANEELKSFWESQIKTLAIEEPSKVVFHEYGIPSHQDAALNPFTEDTEQDANESVQEIWLRASCDVIHAQTAGGYIWAAYYGGDLTDTQSDDTSYNFIGKPTVEATITDCFDWY